MQRLDNSPHQAYQRRREVDTRSRQRSEEARKSPPFSLTRRTSPVMYLVASQSRPVFLISGETALCLYCAVGKSRAEITITSPMI